MELENAERTLKELGFTEYETRVYMRFFSSGTAAASNSSENVTVPHSHIYEILSKLEKEGWIESQSPRPARYRAKPPSESIRLMRIKREKEFKKASKTSLQELEPVYEKKAEIEKPDIWIIRGTENLMGKAREMFTKADIEILITLPNITEEFSDLRIFYQSSKKYRVEITDI